MYLYFRELLKSGVVNANTMVDKHSPSSALLRVCENGLYVFAKTLIEHGAQVKHMASKAVTLGVHQCIIKSVLSICRWIKLGLLIRFPC